MNITKKPKMPCRLLCSFIGFIIVVSLGACRIAGGDVGYREPQAPLDAAGRLAILEDRLFIKAVTGDSLSFHLFVRNPENFGLAAIEPSWGPSWTREYFNEDLVETRHFLEELEKINIDDLKELEDILLYRTLVQNLELTVSMGEYYHYLDPFHPMNGRYAQAPLVLAEFDFRRQEDIDIYIELLRTFDEYIGHQIIYEQEKSQIGLFMPDFVLDMVIDICEGFLADRDGRHYLITTFDHRIDGAEWLDETQKQLYKEENEQVLKEYFFPVYDKIITELSLLRGSGSTRLDEMQKEYYLLLLQRNTSSNFAPEFIIELLDYELKGAIGKIRDAFSKNPDVGDEYFNLALSKGTIEQNMDYLKSIGPSVFPELPPHGLSMETLPEGLQFISAGAFYLTQPVDDYYNSVIRINPDNAENDPSLMFILAHEGYGGHLLESVYSGSSGMGRLRRILNNVAFGEGFANYGAEQLLLASDFDEALVNYAVAVSMLDHYLGARAEIGIFYEGWTVDDLSGMLLDVFGQTLEDEVVLELYEGTYASKYVFIRYGVGTAFFQNLRRSVGRMGSAFDLMAYHTLILDIGAAPLNVVWTTVERSYGLDRVPRLPEDLIPYQAQRAA